MEASQLVGFPVVVHERLVDHGAVSGPGGVAVRVTEMGVIGIIFSKVALQTLSALIVTTPSVQSASPVHPTNEEPGIGVAVKVTTVPDTYDCIQSASHSIPSGVETTFHEPVPSFCTTSS